MIRVGIKTAGLQKLAAKVPRRVNLLGQAGMRPILQHAGEELVEEYKKTIMGFTPGPVDDLVESTKKQKMKQVGFLYPILVRTRRFIESMYSRVMSPAGNGWTIKIGFAGSQGKITNARLAEIHITGEGRMPKRDFTKIPKAWRQRLMNNIRKALSRA